MSTKNAFITGGSGYIGSEVVKKAIAHGWTVRGLSRSESSDAKLAALGATPVRGELTSLDVLASEATKADYFISMAYDLDLDKPSIDMKDASNTDRAVIDAVIGAMRPGSVFVQTADVLVATQPADGSEADETAPYADTAFGLRGHNETYALNKGVEHGVVVNVVRPAAFVYGEQGSAVAMMMASAAENKSAMYIDEGSALVSSVHVRDCAEVYLLAAEKRTSGIYHAVSDNNVSFKQISEAIGEVLKVPSVGVPRATMENIVGPMMAVFLALPSRASGRKAREQLGWKPEEKPILEDITKGSYSKLADSLQAQA
ncbi:Uncharacterized protein C2A9.02 [Ceratocystis fimbriata CBS 114723]|uniref:Uncharacterized protein C2A9.02 n=1 Tax=Ceratocystis fimbriata CBS 114723 TaxID=1035309 RepID=A0A2C5WXW0_9PEZI|nr:Uncharacterized protein C2A9.02 [Ceratocystis fimbriata CBS 114723]